MKKVLSALFFLSTVTAFAASEGLLEQINNTLISGDPASGTGQTVGNAYLQSIDAKTPALVGGRHPVDGSGVTQPVTGTVSATQSGTWNLGRTWNTSSAADSMACTQSGAWTTGRTWSLSGTTDEVSISNFPATNSCTQSGSWAVDVSNFPASQAVTGTFWQATQPVSGSVSISGTAAISAISLPLPAGAATAAKQPAFGTAGFASPDVITVQGVTSMTPLKTDGSGVTQPISGTVSVDNFPEGGTEVSVSNFPATQPVSGTFWQATQPVSLAAAPPLVASSAVIGHVVVDSAPSTAVTGTFWQATQPISAASLPLPTGAAQEHVTADVSQSVRLSDGGAFYKATTPSDTQPVSGPLTNAELRDSAVPVSGPLTDTQLRASKVATDAAASTRKVSTLNSTTSPIAVDPQWTGTGEDVLGYGTADISVFTDQPTSVFVDQSNDNVNWDISDGLIFDASVADSQAVRLVSRYFRIEVQNNGSGPTTTTRIQTTFSPASNALPRTLDAFGRFQVRVVSPVPTTPVTGTFWQATQPVSIATAPVLVAGSAVIGKVGIDQTTPGTTNKVNIGTDGTVAIGAGSAVIGHVIVDTAPSTAVTNVGTFATQATLQTGSAIAGKFGIDQTTPGTTNKVSIGTDGTVALGAGSSVVGHVINDASSAIIGKVGIDQTTPGTTNKVSIGTDGTVAIGAGSAVIGHVIVDTAPSTAVTNTGTFATQSTLAAETTKVIGTVNQGGSNWSQNVAQINGVTPLMGAGNTGTGSPRVTIASDQAAIPVSQSGTWTVQPGNTPNTTPWLQSINDGTNTAKVTAASTAAVAADKALVVSQNPTGGNPCHNPSATLVSATGATSGTAAVQIVALSGTTKIYVCSLSVIGVSGTTPTFSLVQGTGSNCANGQTVVQQSWTTTAGSIYAFANPVAVGVAGNALCYLDTGTSPVQRYTITYVQQ